MLYLSASVVLAMLTGIGGVIFFGPSQVPAWLDVVSWGLIGAGTLYHALGIGLHNWKARRPPRSRLPTPIDASRNPASSGGRVR